VSQAFLTYEVLNVNSDNTYVHEVGDIIKCNNMHGERIKIEGIRLSFLNTALCRGE
jgi:hypothetical protein